MKLKFLFMKSEKQRLHLNKLAKLRIGELFVFRVIEKLIHGEGVKNYFNYD